MEGNLGRADKLRKADLEAHLQLDQLIESRRTIHNFTNEPVDEALLTRALNLSLWAPNHKLTYPWVYTWLKPETREKMGDLAVRLKSARGDLSEIKAKAIKASVTTPSHILSIGQKRSSNPMTQKEDYATLACSVQILSMVLWEQGVGTKWSTGGWSMHEEMYKQIKLNPDEVTLEGAILIGRPQQIPSAPKRPPLNIETK